MSSVYVTEPATSGRVVFETTHGPLEIQLWCRECPLTTKLFLQLCMDGFYQDMLFHRIMSDFLIQTGAVRQQGKEAGFTKEYQKQVDAPTAMERRTYETHSRLRFNHRGQIAMALGVGDDSDDDALQPQFFITLDEAPYLDGKHVLFGTCSGPTIFNALRIGKLAVNEETNQPLDWDFAPRVTGVKIVENPVHTSLSATASVPWQQKAEEKQKKKKKKRKGKKDLNVLSFGDEMEMGEEEVGIKSSHDVVSSKTLSRSVDEKVKQQVAAAAIDNGDDALPREEVQPNATAVIEPESSDELDMKPAYKPSSIPAPLAPPPMEQPKKEEEPKKPKKVSLVEARLARFKKNKGSSKRQREEDTMAKLQAFSSKVRKKSSESKGKSKDDDRDNSLAARMARKAEEAAKGNGERDNGGDESYHGQVLDNDDDEHTSDWMATKFKCRRHIDHSSRVGGSADHEKGGDGRDMNDYEVIDSKRSDDNNRRHRKRSDGHRRNRR